MTPSKPQGCTPYGRQRHQNWMHLSQMKETQLQPIHFQYHHRNEFIFSQLSIECFYMLLKSWTTKVVLQQSKSGHFVFQLAPFGQVVMFPMLAHRDLFLFFVGGRVGEVQEILKLLIGDLILQFYKIMHLNFSIHLCVFCYPNIVFAVLLCLYLLELFIQQINIFRPFAKRILSYYFFHLIKLTCYPGRHGTLLYYIVQRFYLIQNNLELRKKVYLKVHIGNIPQTICGQKQRAFKYIGISFCSKVFDHTCYLLHNLDLLPCFFLYAVLAMKNQRVFHCHIDVNILRMGYQVLSLRYYLSDFFEILQIRIFYTRKQIIEGIDQKWYVVSVRIFQPSLLTIFRINSDELKKHVNIWALKSTVRNHSFNKVNRSHFKNSRRNQLDQLFFSKFAFRPVVPVGRKSIQMEKKGVFFIN